MRDGYSPSRRPLAASASSFLGDLLLQRKTHPSLPSAQSSKLGEARERCRNGNPFPLIEMQWPELRIKNGESPIDYKLFQEVPVDKLSRVPGSLIKVLTNKDLKENPVLRLDWWQKLFIAGFFDVTVGEVYVKGCTGAGKGAATAIAISLWFDVYESSRTSLTSRSYDHAIKNIFGETKQWFLKMDSPIPCSVLTESITNSERRYIAVLNPSPKSATAGEAFSGAHGENTLYVFDEASASASREIVENAEKNARKIVCLSNPRTMRGNPFRDAFSPLGTHIDEMATCNGSLGARLCITVSGADCMNVRHRRLKRPVAPQGGIRISGRQFNPNDPIPKRFFGPVRSLIPSQIDLLQYNAICNKSDPRLVEIFAHGKFPKEDPERQLILASWLDRCIAMHLATPPTVQCFGFDIARSLDGDVTALTAGGQKGIAKVHRWQYNDTQYHVDNALRICKADYLIDLTLGRNPVCVDCDGLGVGVADTLKRLGVWVIEFRGNASSKVDPRTYQNLRCEAFATLARRLDPNDQWGGDVFALPNDENLLQELTAPEKIYSPNDASRFRITPKTKPPGNDSQNCIKDVLGRSPDSGDSVAYCFHAIREYHDMNEWFKQSQRSLLVWPPPGGVTKENSRFEPTTEIGKFHKQHAEGSLDVTVKPKTPAEEAKELVEKEQMPNYDAAQSAEDIRRMIEEEERARLAGGNWTQNVRW